MLGIQSILRIDGGIHVKRIIIQLNGGEHINIPADRMEIKENDLRAWNGMELVAYVDTSAVICAYMSEKG